MIYLYHRPCSPDLGNNPRPPDVLAIEKSAAHCAKGLEAALKRHGEPLARALRIPPSINPAVFVAERIIRELQARNAHLLPGMRLALDKILPEVERSFEHDLAAAIRQLEEGTGWHAHGGVQPSLPGGREEFKKKQAVRGFGAKPSDPKCRGHGGGGSGSY